MTLVDFLLARIAEDERRADAFELGDPMPFQWSSVERLGWPPKRIRAECEAKRWIVALHNPCDDWSYGDPSTCPELVALASAYADHLDYDEAWRP